VRPPAQLGPYPILGVLGQGGMGTVFRSYHPELQCDLAIKTLAATGEAAKRFQREIESLAQLRHPGLVEIVEAGEQNGVPWFAMRAVPGGTLEDRLGKSGPLPAEEVVGLGVQLCAALSVAHAQGILHRDLKPANVLYGSSGEFVLTDFGLSKNLVEEASTRLSRTGSLQGTPGYWAPEQASGLGKDASPRTDVYGVGATLYAALTGEPPIQAGSVVEFLIATREQAPRPPSELAPVPRELERVILRCLEKSPQDRFESLEELSAALSSAKLEDAPSGRGPRLLLGLAALVLLLALVPLATLGLGTKAPATPSPTADPTSAETSAAREPHVVSVRPWNPQVGQEFSLEIGFARVTQLHLEFAAIDAKPIPLELRFRLFAMGRVESVTQGKATLKLLVSDVTVSTSGATGALNPTKIVTDWKGQTLLADFDAATGAAHEVRWDDDAADLPQTDFLLRLLDGAFHFFPPEQVPPSASWKLGPAALTFWTRYVRRLLPTQVAQVTGMVLSLADKRAALELPEDRKVLVSPDGTWSWGHPWEGDHLPLRKEPGREGGGQARIVDGWIRSSEVAESARYRYSEEPGKRPTLTTTVVVTWTTSLELLPKKTPKED
jgi:protein kinase-like protein